MLYDLTPEQRELESLMSDISEKCWAAGWLGGTEYGLWEAVLNGERAWGQDKITQEDIQKLFALSRKYNCWIYMDDVKEESAVDLITWVKIYNDATSGSPGLVKRDQ